MQAFIDNAERERRLRAVDDEIETRKQKISTLVGEQEAEIDKLQQSRLQPRTLHAGAAGEQAVATEMEAVTERYRTRIEVEQNEIIRLDGERATLKH